MENLEFNLEEIFNEVRTRMQNEGAMTKEEYIDTIEEILEEKREEGLVDDDYNVKQAQEAIAMRWEEMEESLAEGKVVEEEGLSNVGA